MGGGQCSIVHTQIRGKQGRLVADNMHGVGRNIRNVPDQGRIKGRAQGHLARPPELVLGGKGAPHLGVDAIGANQQVDLGRRVVVKADPHCPSSLATTTAITQDLKPLGPHAQFDGHPRLLSLQRPQQRRLQVRPVEARRRVSVVVDGAGVGVAREHLARAPVQVDHGVAARLAVGDGGGQGLVDAQLVEDAQARGVEGDAGANLAQAGGFFVDCDLEGMMIRMRTREKVAEGEGGREACDAGAHDGDAEWCQRCLWWRFNRWGG